MKRIFLSLLALLFCFSGVNADAASSGTIARILDGGQDTFLLKAPGLKKQLLFVDIDADVYQTSGTHAGDHTVSSLQMSGEDGCGGDSETEAARSLCVQVVASGSTSPLCWAGRPAQPGWMRDPMLACQLDGGVTYQITVFAAGPEPGVCGLVPTPPVSEDARGKRVYQMKVTLQDVAAEGALIPLLTRTPDSF